MTIPRAKALSIIVAVIVVIILALGFPWWIHARSMAMEKACIDNLRSIDGAKLQWALESGKGSNATPTWADLAPYLNGGPPFCAVGPSGNQWGFRLPKYPPNATYTIGRVADSPTCSYAGHTFALCGLMIHVGDESIDSENGEVFESYDLPGSTPIEPRKNLRLVGSIIGATVKVLDGAGHWTRVETQEDGTAYLDALPIKPVAIVVSKDGFLTSSNSIRHLYQYKYDILLIQRPN